jgi:hypothetical protein
MTEQEHTPEEPSEERSEEKIEDLEVQEENADAVQGGKANPQDMHFTSPG